MEFDKVIQKRLRGMAVRILACIEHTIQCDLGDLKDEEEVVLTGADLKIARSEILNAAGDTTRSLTQLVADSPPGKVSFSRDIIKALGDAEVDVIEEDDVIPVFRIFGDFNLLNKIRNSVGAGIVYKKVYTCAGLDDIVDSLLPFLDLAQIAGVKIAHGDYREWRDVVCEIYLEGLGNE
jgi:hypothetical protein